MRICLDCCNELNECVNFINAMNECFMCEVLKCVDTDRYRELLESVKKLKQHKTKEGKIIVKVCEEHAKAFLEMKQRA